MATDQAVETTSLSYFFTKIKSLFATLTEYNQKVATTCPYPVGTIYLSISSTNPSSYFGGTWSTWGAGKVPVCIDTTDTDFDTVNMTGGEKTHTLTLDELGSHSHEYTGVARTTSPRGAYGNASRKNIASLPTETTGSAGGGLAHNNLQPYITCYMWERTA